MIAAALGVGVAWLAMNAFGLWVAFHPFGRHAERTTWLVPLLQILSWLPFVAFGALIIAKWLCDQPLRLGIAAGFSSVTAVLAAYHIAGASLMETASLSWLNLALPLVFFPVLGWLLANKSFKRTPHGGAA